MMAGMSALLIFAAAGCGETSDESSQINDDKVISEELFVNPSLDDRPMVQMHSPTQILIDDVYERGYGGIVMNVAWANDYLNNPRAWANFASCVDYAVGLGMHVWIYDEYGYPSGAAYGQTLKGNPEYEALGLVPGYAAVPAGETATVELLYGHTRIEAAYIYEGSSVSSMDLSSAEDVSSLIEADGSSVTYANRSGTDRILVAYMSKRWYENTHSMENWYAQQRYINMLDPEPTVKFLDLTHEKYFEAVGELFGKGIQAFFTDEPALQGSYFEISDRPRTVLDEPDPNIPIVESLNYSSALFERFKEVYSYDLKPLLGYLYNDDGSTAAKQVRMDFYALTGELFRQNYLEQTSDWCEEHSVKSSGHLLLEETLYQNPWFAGNMLQLLGTMGIPGTDLLFSTARRAAQDAAITSKMAAAAAEWTGKEDTFAEISGAFDGTVGDMYSQLNAVGVQVAMGINTFSSYYYQGNDHTAAEDQIFSAAIGRMRYMVTGSEHQAKVAVYYPYEGVSAETLPSKNMYQPTENARFISDSFAEVCQSLTSKQVDYDLVDAINLAACTVEDGALVSPAGEHFSAVVVPFTTALRSEALLKLLEAEKAGVKILLIGGIEEIVCERGKDDVAARFQELLEASEMMTSGLAAGNWLRANGHAVAVLDDAFASDIYITKRENDNYSVFTAVNAYMEDREVTMTLEAEGKEVRFFDSVSGEIIAVNNVSFQNGKVSFRFTLPANRTGFFVITK